MLSYFGLVEEGHVLDVPNAAIGLVYYTYWLLLMPSFPKMLTCGVSSLAMMASVFLACRLLILKELCILCWTTHVINARLLWSAVVGVTKDKSSSSSSSGPAKIKRV